jgi:DNA-binding winged helix-turn-helix (wHTH) protein
LGDTGRRGSIRFGVYELDLDRRQLLRDGFRIHLQPLPFKILTVLAGRAGQLVTRDEIQSEIWPGEVAGDFHARLNFCIRRIRESLDDDADHPRYIKTIRKDGYLFIAPVELKNGGNSRDQPDFTIANRDRNTGEANVAHETQSMFELPGTPFSGGKAPAAIARPHTLIRRGAWLALAGFALGLAGYAVFYLRPPTAQPQLSNATQLTHDGRPKVGLTTDGQRVYTTEEMAGQWQLVQIPISGGAATVIPTPFEASPVDDISTDGSKLLVEAYNGRPSPRDLWIVPASGGEPQRVGNVRATCAAWSPDGARIAYGTSEGLWVSDAGGVSPRKIASFPGAVPEACRWSPDGRRLRSSIYYPDSNNTKLVEVSSDGSRILTLSRSLGEASGFGSFGWSPDGADFLFWSARRLYRSTGSLSRVSQILGLSPTLSLHATAIETGVLTPGYFCFTPSGNKLLALDTTVPRYQFVRLQTSTRTMEPYLPGLSASYANFSHDGRWMAWVDMDDDTLWKSRADGSERVQLTTPPLEVQLPRWSPHDKTIAFMALTHGRPWQVFLVPPEGGRPRALVSTKEGQGAPTWSPDGERLMFGHVECEIVNNRPVEVFNLKKQTLAHLPDSYGLRTARWSPDGRYAAAMNPVRNELLLFDFRTRRWKVAARQVTGDQIEWSQNSRYIYGFDPNVRDPYLFRVRVADMAYQRVCSLKKVALMGDVNWFGFAPDGSLVLAYAAYGQEIYAFDWSSGARPK